MIGYRWNSGTKTWEQVDVTKERLVAWGFLACAFVICCIIYCYDATIGRRLEISNAEYYCTSKQLAKTGEMACIKAKQKLRKRYQNELSSKQKTLAELKNNTNTLSMSEQEKCSSSGVAKYGTSGCSNARSDVRANAKAIASVTKEINHYQVVINALQVPNLYYVDATALNLRSCQGTDCKIISSLPSKTDVYIEKDFGEWVEVDTDKGHGYVLKRYLTKVGQSVKNGNSYNPLENISFNIDRDIDEQIVSNQKQNSKTKEEVSVKEEKGLSPLIVAIRHNNHKEIEQLIKNGANVKDNVPCTANYSSEDACMSILNLAVKYVDDPEIIKSIVEAGINLNNVYETGLSELDVAVFTAVEYNKNIEVLRFLLDKGANVKVSNEGYNLLMAASSYNQNPEMVKFLISHGIDINAMDAEQNTALIYAVMKNKNPEVIKVLLDMGADVLAKDMEGHIALDYANNNPPLKSSPVYSQLSGLTNKKRMQQAQKMINSGEN